MFKVYDYRNRQMRGRFKYRPMGAGVFKIYDAPESPNEGRF